MRLGDKWRVAIEKKHREKLKMQEDQASRQETKTEQEGAATLPQEAITK
jgi:hypothetical protein